MKNYSIIDDGFTFLPKIFKKDEITSARDGLWKTINGIYETSKKPETRFWEVGDDKNKIIKIGVGFSYQKVKKVLINRYDKKMNLIITEKDFFK